MVNIYNIFSLLANKQLVESLPEGLLVFLPIMVMILFVWALVWKGFALWKSAKLNQKYWFIAMLVINKAKAVCEKANGQAVSFFFAQSKFYKKFRAERETTGAICHKALYGGLAVCLPVSLIPSMLDFYDKDYVMMDDHRINRFLMSQKINIYCPIPSLVDHRVGNMSVFTGKPSETQACEYIDRK